MSTPSITRSIVPRQALFRRALAVPRPLSPRLLRPVVRNASTKQSDKPIVLEKPDKFRPPSHPSRLPRKIRNYGPTLSQAEKQQQQTKRYPHMMPPEGSFMHSFLTAKYLHAWIAMSVLFSLAFYIFLQDFLHTTPYTDLLPPKSELLTHPINSISQFLEVYKMHVAYVSAETADKRRKKVEDVQKRAEYRKAHGLEDKDAFFGWSLKEDEKADPADTASPIAPEAENPAQNGGSSDEYVDFEGKKRKPVKKWLGIW